MQAKSLIDAAPCAQVIERDPGVPLVPDDWRQCAHEKHSKERVQTGPPELMTKARCQSDNEDDRNNLERIGVLAQKSEPNEKPGRGPISGKLGTSLERQPEHEHRRCPKEDRQGINRHYESTDIKNRRDIQRDCQRQAGVRAKQAAAEIKQKQTRAG